MTVAAVTSGDAAVRFLHHSDRLVLTLPSAPATGDLRRFTVKYRGVPASGLKALQNKYGERCFFSADWPDLAHQWLPVVDHPYDKATGEFFVTGPSRTGDIEQRIQLGAHGPRRLHIVLVEDAPPQP